jgi:hypothetical protein
LGFRDSSFKLYELAQSAGCLQDKQSWSGRQIHSRIQKPKSLNGMTMSLQIGSNSTLQL